MHHGPNQGEQKLALIYIIVNRVNGKVYVGQHRGENVQARLRNHIKDARRGCPLPLHRAICKYGPDNFEAFALSTYASSQADLDAQETFYIQKYQTLNPAYGYNLLPGGRNSAKPASTRAKISAARKKQTAPMTGKNHSTATKKLQSQKRAAWCAQHPEKLGHSFSAVSRARISKATKGRKPSIPKGTKLPAATREKIRLAALIREGNKRETRLNSNV